MDSTRRCAGGAGRAESACGPLAGWQAVRHLPSRPRDRCDDQLCDAIAASHGVGAVAVIDEDHADLAAIVGVDGAGAVEHGDAGLESEAGAGPYLRLELRGQRDGDAGADQGALPGRQDEIRGQRGKEVEPGGQWRRITRQRQAVAVRQPPQRHGDALGIQVCAAKWRTMRSTSRSATSIFDSVGQCSTVPSEMRWTVFCCPPNVPVPGETSLATIQSQPFAARLAVACPTTRSGSAAKAMTNRGLALPAPESVARISGLTASSSRGGLAPAFFSFWPAGLAIFQSATAAAHTATSAGSAARQDASISSAVSTWRTVTPGGSGSAVGPETSTVSAPRRARAAAIAWP